MKKRLSAWQTWGLITIAGLGLYFGGPLDLACKYYSFHFLTKEKLIAGAEFYVHDRTSDKGQLVCLYVVDCDGGTARLERVDDIDRLDLDKLKQTIWKRRFSSYCPGRTTNMGLHLIPKVGHEPEIESTANARWSFFNDRFIPQRGRFQSGAFTDQAWETCTPEASLNRQLKF